MPIYEYDCPECGRFEVIQKVNAKALKECPTCSEAGKHTKVTRAVSAAAFHLKGSGWYKTDYGSSNGSSKSATSIESKEKKSDASEKEVSPKKDASKKGGSCGSGCGCH